jgi:hypothetical protein
MIELFNKLIEVRDVSHQMHFNGTDKGYHHEALEEFYTDILEHLDTFVEVYQGQYGLVDNFGEFNSVDFSDKEKYFTEFATFVNSKRSEINDDEAVHLQAIIDDIMITTYKLLYKLKVLK